MWNITDAGEFLTPHLGLLSYSLFCLASGVFSVLVLHLDKALVDSGRASILRRKHSRRGLWPRLVVFTAFLMIADDPPLEFNGQCHFPKHGKAQSKVESTEDEQVSWISDVVETGYTVRTYSPKVV
jgi:hypothetical protein